MCDCSTILSKNIFLLSLHASNSCYASNVKLKYAPANSWLCYTNSNSVNTDKNEADNLSPKLIRGVFKLYDSLTLL